MAKRNRKGQFQKRKSGGGRKVGGSTKVVRVASSPTTIRVAAPAAKRRTVRRRRSSGGGRSGLGGLLGHHAPGNRTAIIIGSALLGYAQKQGWTAKVPLVGKAGAITSFGLLGWGAEELLHMKLPSIVKDMITSALSLSAFNIGFTGGTTIVGEQGYQMPGGAVFFD